MKSNIIRYLLVGLITAVCATTASKTSAYSMWDLWNNYRFCNWSTYPITNEFYVNPSYQNQYYNTGNWYIWAVYDTSLNLDYASPLVYSRNSWYHYKNLGGWNMSCSYVSYPLVWIDTNNQNWLIFKYFVDWDTPSMENFVVESRAWFQHTFWDWTSCVMDQVYFNVWSIIFKCSDSNRTYQILAWGYTLWNHILYVDIVNSSNNVWWISWAENKAWSVTVSQAVRSQIVYGWLDINQSFLENMFNSWYISYTISEGWNNIWPSCWLASCTAQSDDWSSWYLYSRDLVQVAPDFWASSNPDSNSWAWVILSWSVSQQEELQQYNSCIDRYINVNDLSSFWYSCRQDYENNKLTREQYLAIENYVLDLNSNTPFSWSTVTDNCFLMSDIALNMFDTHSWTYTIDVNLAWRGSSSTDWIDLSYLCWSRPSGSSSEGGVNRWQDLLNRIWLWSSEVSSWSSVFDTTITSFKNMISDPFNEYIIDPIQSEYNSWYSMASPVACVTTNNSFAYWDYILYFGAVFLVLVLYWFFF